MSTQTPGFTPAGPAGPSPAAAPKSPAAKKSRLYVGIAVILGLLCAAALLFATTDPADESYVVRTKEPILAQTILTPEMVEAVAIPNSAIEDGTFAASTKEKALEKIDFTAQPRVQYPLRAKAQVGVEDLRFEDKLAVELRPDERLISVEASAASAIAGQIRVGDLVDIIVVGGVNVEELGLSDDVANVIYTSAEVVAVDVEESRLREARVSDDDADDSRTTAFVPGIYTLKVRVDAAPRVALAEATGTLYLLYRGADAEDSAVRAYTPKSAYCDSFHTPEAGQVPSSLTACS